MGFIDVLIARWRTLRCGDVAAVFLLAAIVGIVAIAVVKFPNFSRTGNLGFGPEWDAAIQAEANQSASRSPRPPDESAKKAY
jgi:hypothetical protein